MTEPQRVMLPSATIRLTLERSASDRWSCTEYQLVHALTRADGGLVGCGLTVAPEQWRGTWSGVWAPALGQTVTAETARDLADKIGRTLANDQAVRFRPGVYASEDTEALCDDSTLLAFSLFLRRGGFRIVPLDDPWSDRSMDFVTWPE